MITLSNPNRTIELPAEGTRVYRTDKLKPGEFGRSTKENAYAYGISYSLYRFEVGAVVIIPLSEDFCCDWECFEVVSNPHYQQFESEQNHSPREISFDEFNVRRHGQE